MGGEQENMIFLDTHIVVWLYAGHIKKLTPKARTLINTHEISISPIVKLELQYLYEIGKITETPEVILSTLEADIGLQIIKSDMGTLMNVAVQINWTRDPFDRIIVAEAKLKNAYLITADKIIHKKYPKSQK